jgi:hypothetical protein
MEAASSCKPSDYLRTTWRYNRRDNLKPNKVVTVYCLITQVLFEEQVAEF